MNTSLRSSWFAIGGASLLLACSGAVAPLPTQPEKPEPAAPTPDPRYQALPAPGPAPAWVPPASKKTTLKNGLSVWSMGGSSTPLISIQLMLPVGGSSDPPGKAGLSALTADMLDEGAGKYSAVELSDRLGELATDYATTAGVDYVLLSMNSLAETLPESLELLADIVQRPKLSKDEFERRKKHHLASALEDQDEPAASRSKATSRVLFGDGYAGNPPSGTMASLDTITWQDVKKHTKTLTVPEGAHLTIAGMVDHEQALSAVESAFGTWRGKLTPPKKELSTITPSKKAYVVDFPGAAQSALGIVTRAGAHGDPNYFAEEVMNERLGSSFTSRINMNLREDKGYTYGAGSFFARHRKAGYFGIVTNVKSETTGASVKEIFSELSSLCSGRPLTSAERAESVEGLLLGFPMMFDEVGSMGTRLVSLPVHGRETDFWQTWPEQIKSITTERANQAAAPYCDPARYSVIVAGDSKSVGPMLAAQGFEVIELDRDGNPKAAAKPDVK